MAELRARIVSEVAEKLLSTEQVEKVAELERIGIWKLPKDIEATLIATSTRKPADSSNIWPIARRRVASDVIKGIAKRDQCP